MGAVRNVRPCYTNTGSDINKAAGILTECVPAVRIIIERVVTEKRAHIEEQAEELWIWDCTTRVYCHEECLASEIAGIIPM